MIPWWNIVIPQFRSIIPCEVLLYIEVIFLGFIHWYGDFLVFLGSFLSIKSPTQTNGEVWKTSKNTSITECFAATSTFTQYRFGKSFKAQLWENAHNVIKSTEKSDIHVFNCNLCHVSFLLTCYVCSTKIGENSDIFKCF